MSLLPSELRQRLPFTFFPFSIDEDQTIIKKADTIGVILRNSVANDGESPVPTAVKAEFQGE
jgi:hypothetical protein